jgi:hypothetical protein
MPAAGGFMQKYLFPLWVSVFALLSCSGPVDDPAPDQYNSEEDVRLSVPSDFLGMVHAGDRSEEAREYALLDELGVQWMLTDFSWSRIEPSRGDWRIDAFDTYVNRGKRHGKKILAILDYDTGWLHEGKAQRPDGPLIATPEERALFCEYVRRTVDYYKGRVDAWCIWNEPNLQPRFWASEGTKEQFFDLTKEAAAAIRETVPEAVIIGGAFNTLVTEDWIDGLFESGAMDQVDAIAFHPYALGGTSTGNLYNMFKQYVTPHGYAGKIWVTEVGYPTGGEYPTKVTEDRMPETVIKTISLLAVNGANHVLWYHLFDPRPENQEDKDSEDWFGLVKNDFTRKNGADAYRICASFIPGKTYISRFPMRSGLPDTIMAWYFEGGDGNHTLIIWNDSEYRDREVSVTLPGAHQTVYNPVDGSGTPCGETSAYTLYRSGSAQPTLYFFTWENSDPSQPPRISAP